MSLLNRLFIIYQCYIFSISASSHVSLRGYETFAADSAPLASATLNATEMPLLSNYSARRRFLVVQMNAIEKQLDDRLARRDWREVNRLIDRLNNHVIPPLEEITNHINYRKDLREIIARIRFKAGLRACESPDKAYSEVTGRCETTGRFAPSQRLNPCPSKEREMFVETDIERGIGSCLCRYRDDFGRRLYERNGDCYVLNEKGFCQEGHWIVQSQDSEELKCERAPNGCPTDGFHSFSIFSLVSDRPACYRLGKSPICPKKDPYVTQTESGQLACTRLTYPAFAFGIAPLRIG